MSDLCLSGGAIGSDLAWGQAAVKNGHRAIHFSFDGHRTKMTNVHGERIILTPEQLETGRPFAEQAAKNLKRASLTKRTTFVQNLLLRNWWQVRDAKSVYAVGVIDHDKNIVKGGTGYAVQMFINRGVMTAVSGPWVFDQEVGSWFQWNRSWARWDKVERPPHPSDKYAGVGTRELNQLGLSAIFEVYK